MNEERIKAILKYIPVACAVLSLFLTIIWPLALTLSVVGLATGFYYRYKYDSESIVVAGMIACSVYIIMVLMVQIGILAYNHMAGELLKGNIKGIK